MRDPCVVLTSSHLTQTKPLLCAFNSVLRFMLLRHHKRPTMYDEELAVSFCGWLPRALAMHAIGGFFAYGAGTTSFIINMIIKTAFLIRTWRSFET